MDWRGDRSVSVSSSPSLSPKAIKIKMSGLNGEGWDKEVYSYIFLNLLEQTMTGHIIFDGKLGSEDFWKSFTARLNILIKESLPEDECAAFSDFAPYEVTEYGKKLGSTYSQNKDKFDAEERIVHFQLYRRVFERCDHWTPLFPPQEWMLGIEKLRSNSYASSASTGTTTTSGTREAIFDSITTVLGNLVNTEKITPPQSALALKAFVDDDILGILWLKMNDSKRLMCVTSLGNQVDQSTQGSGY